MQKPRRWRGLELELLSLVLGCTSACSAPPAPRARITPPAAENAPVPVPVPVPVPDSPSSPQAEADPASAPSSPSPARTPAALPQGTRVLQLGDSFAAALGIDLGKMLKDAGLRTSLEYKTASYIPNWSYDGDVPQFVSKYQPDLVLVTLGANEIEIPKPEERAKPIRHLVASLGGRPCVWIAPPLWKPDTGLLKVIKGNVAPCRYLDSNALVHDLPRAQDKIHPSTEGRKIWAKAVFDWLVQERVGNATQPWALKPEPANP